MRITNSGTYEPCRWMTKKYGDRVNFDLNLKTKSPSEYFQNDMAGLRQQLLKGQAPDMCQDCRIMEQHNKPSGRQRQLLKVGVQLDHFEKSLASSTLRQDFDYSNKNQGHTTRVASDWQIDLGNYCNGACVFCGPENSSTLATEFKKIGLSKKVPGPAWCDDPELLDRFVSALVQSPNLHYLHFLGGETVITPGFKKILSALIEHGLAAQTTIGFTTNLTVWSVPIVELLRQFQQVNLGLSVETLTPVNDYVRYPSQLDQTQEILDRWVALSQQQGWLAQLRVTPTCLTVHELDTVYDYAWQNKIPVESCNFLHSPAFLRISVLPPGQRVEACNRLRSWIAAHPINNTEQIVNTRNPSTVKPQIVQDAKSYLQYLESTPDESALLPDLVQYLKRLENNRRNSIIDYIPKYENIFRSAGY